MSEAEEEKKAKPRRRRWPWVLLFLLIGGLLWFDGPGARLVIRKTVPDYLQDLGLSGDYQISGQLHSGLTLTNLDLTGTQLIKKAKAEVIKIHYNPIEVIFGKAQSLTIHGLDLVIDLDQLPESTEEEKDPASPLMETLNSVREFITPLAIDIQDIRLRVEKTVEEKDAFARVAFASLSHARGSSEFILTGFESESSQTKTHLSPPTTLVWEENHLTLDQLDLIPDVSIRNLDLSAPSLLKSDLLLAGSTFQATSDLQTSHTFQLGETPLDLATLRHLLPEDFDLTGTVSTLNLTANLPKSGPRNLTLNFQAQDLHYQENTVHNLSAQAALDGSDATYKIDTAFKIADALDGTFSAEGTGLLDEEIQKSTTSLNWKLATKEYPAVTGTAAWADEKAAVTATTLEKVTLQASFDPATQTYQAEAHSGLTDARKLYPGLAAAIFELKAEGDLKKETHQGSLNLKDLRYLAEDSPPISASGQANWNWPEQFSFQNLLVKRDGLEVKSSLTWKEGFAKISQLLIADAKGSLLTGKGSLPLPLQARNLDDLLANNSPIDFSIQLDSTPIARFAENIEGHAQASLKLTGTFAKPIINGQITATQVRDPSLEDIPATDLSITLTTENEQLHLTGNLREPGGDLLDLSGQFPLTPEKWIKDPDSLMDEPLVFSANTPRIDLRRLQKFLPQVTDLSGVAEVNLQIAGTPRKPDISGDAFIQADRARLKNSPISDFRNSKIRVQFRDNIITIPPSQITAAGGTIDISGSVTLGDTPIFDLSLRGKNTLLWRDSAYSLRADPNLTLKGPFDSARLSGSIPIVESIVYKDVEILPFGIPTKDVERPNVPDLSAVASDELYSLPEPFASWPLDIAVTTKDPIIIRGNLITGDLLINAHLGGTLGKLSTSGTITSRDLKADLPFSNLLIQNGTLTLNPKSLTDPTISIKGNAKVSGYNVQLYVAGPVSDPSISIISDPPLPESEILMLLSTGATSSTLNDRTVASQKALQYLLQGLRRRYGKQDAKGLLQRLLKNIDEVDLSLGDYNRFSGRHFTSATIDISDQWTFSTAIDEEGNTRNTVIFSIRFR